MEAQVGTGRPQPPDNSLAALRRLKVLGSAGPISREREAQWRPCGLETDQLKAVDGWLDRQRHFRHQSFDKIETARSGILTSSKTELMIGRA
jgi:hypothetical protein